MSALKHMERIFGVVVVAACITAAMPAADRAPAPAESARAAAVTTAMPVIVVKGKRMTALEKRAAIGAEANRDDSAGT